MQDFSAFVLRHWELWLAFVIILGYWLSLEFQEHKSDHALTTQQLVTAMNRENAVVIDLRDNNAFRQGRILGSLSFPEKTLADQLNKLKKYQHKPVILVDGTGQSAPNTLKMLAKQGFTKLSYLKGGIQAWLQEKLPLEKGAGDKS